MNYSYLKENSVLPQYLQFPEFLLNLPISQTAKIIYMLLYDRARLSQKNNWLDKDGRVYIIFPIKEISKKIGKGETAVKQALSDLDTAGLLRRKKGGYSKPNHIYLRIVTDEPLSATDTKATSAGADNRPSNGRKTVSTKGAFPPPNKVIETSNKKQSKKTTVSVTNNFGKTLKSAMPDYSCMEGESL